MRVGVVSDIHGNLEALQAVLKAMEPCDLDAVWCLGDLVGYGPDPNACVETARALAWQCVAGNHDVVATTGDGLEEFNPAAAAALSLTARNLSPENRLYLAGLPSHLVMADVTLVHGSPRNPIWEYVSSIEVARHNLDRFQTLLCLVGHTHMPAVFTFSDGRASQARPQSGIETEVSAGRHVLNPGSVGQPRDGDPRAAFAILDLARGAIVHHRAEYNIAATQGKMLAAGLPSRLAARLEHGW